MPKRSRKPEHLVQVATRGGPFQGVDRRTVARRAGKMLRHLSARDGLGPAELSIALVDDPTIHELNRDYRQMDKPTDVLAFAMRESDPPPRPDPRDDRELLGDVVISVDTARRQARGRPLLDELTMLLAHGILHLIGYDHQSDDDERVMTARTRELEAIARRAAGRE